MFVFLLVAFTGLIRIGTALIVQKSIEVLETIGHKTPKESKEQAIYKVYKPLMAC
jgi:hypothetical protein